jgi:hypothetical protein
MPYNGVRSSFAFGANAFKSTTPSIMSWAASHFISTIEVWPTGLGHIPLVPLWDMPGQGQALNRFGMPWYFTR